MDAAEAVITLLATLAKIDPRTRTAAYILIAAGRTIRKIYGSSPSPAISEGPVIRSYNRLVAIRNKCSTDAARRAIEKEIGLHTKLIEVKSE